MVGVVAGLIAGGVPGFTIAMAVVLTLPFTFGMDAVQGLAVMMGVFVGGLSGGLMSGNLDRHPRHAVFGGHDLRRLPHGPCRQSRASHWASASGRRSLAASSAPILLVTLAPQLARIGLEFQQWDYFALVLFALTITASLAGENLVKGLIAGALGLLIATVGEDEINGVARFHFGSEALKQGFGFLPVLIGLFAFSQLVERSRGSRQSSAIPGRERRRCASESSIARQQ